MKDSIRTWGQSISVIFILMLFILELRAQQVNCRKYVFAPLCRGVAAKRGEVSSALVLPDRTQRNSNYENEEDINEVQIKPDTVDYSWDMLLGPAKSKSKLPLRKINNIRDSNLVSKNNHTPKLLYVYDYEK